MIALLLGILQLGISMPPPGHCVLDETGVLSSSEVTTIENDCAAVRGRFYVVIPASLRGMSALGFSSSLFRNWGISNTGALVVVAPRERKWQIMTGGALKHSLNDAKAADIGMTYGVPSFKRGLWGVGLISIEHSMLPYLNMPAPAPVVNRKVTTTTKRVVVGATPSYGYVHHYHWGAFWIFLAILALVVIGFWVVSTIQESREEARREARAAEERAERRRASVAAAASQPRPDWDSVAKPAPASAPAPAPSPAYSSPTVSRPMPASVPAPVNINVSQNVSAPRSSSMPAVVPIPVPVPITPYPRYGYSSPVVVVDDPIYVPPPAPTVIEETTTTVEETRSTYDDSPGGAGGGFDDDSPSVSSNDDYGGGGGSFDSDSGGSDTGSSDDGGGGGDF